jgi:ElaB/YqjD/DUF883 family membrane-anchored ribosome-binding protein
MVENADPSATALASNSEVAKTEREIERTRARVSQSIVALREAVAKRTDWREWVRERPGLFVAAAFAFGILWGRRSGRRSGPAGSR